MSTFPCMHNWRRQKVKHLEHTRAFTFRFKQFDRQDQDHALSIYGIYVIERGINFEHDGDFLQRQLLF